MPAAELLSHEYERQRTTDPLAHIPSVRRDEPAIDGGSGSKIHERWRDKWIPYS